MHGAGIYANIWGILMGSMLPYIAYMDPMGMMFSNYETMILSYYPVTFLDALIIPLSCILLYDYPTKLSQL